MKFDEAIICCRLWIKNNPTDEKAQETKGLII